MPENKPPLDTAVALNYDGENAPIVSASGTGDVAEEIVRIAAEHGVHLHQDPVLSRMLATLDIGTEIPRELYELIAEIIAFAYHLQGKVPADWVPPEAPLYDPVPGLGFDDSYLDESE